MLPAGAVERDGSARTAGGDAGWAIAAAGAWVAEVEADLASRTLVDADRYLALRAAERGQGIQ